MELLLTGNALCISMILSLLQHLSCLLLQSIDNKQQAFSALVLLHSLLDSMSQLLMHMPAVQKLIGSDLFWKQSLLQVKQNCRCCNCRDGVTAATAQALPRALEYCTEHGFSKQSLLDAQYLLSFK